MHKDILMYGYNIILLSGHKKKLEQLPFSSLISYIYNKTNCQKMEM